jgi:hypothetical protein
MTVRLIFAAALAALLTTPLMAQVQKKEMPGIRNYSRVDATVGCGGQVDPAAMKALKGEGYVSVINLRLPNEEGANVEAGRAAAQAAGLKYIHLPFNAAQPDPKVVWWTASSRPWRTRATSRSSSTAVRPTASAACG